MLLHAPSPRLYTDYEDCTREEGKRNPRLRANHLGASVLETETEWISEAKCSVYPVTTETRDLILNNSVAAQQHITMDTPSSLNGRPKRS